MVIKIQYLGTGAAEALPGLYCECDLCRYARRVGGKEIRTRSQALVDDQILIDFPPDTNLHLLQHPEIRLSQIHTLLITHSHSDHLYPQDLFFRCPDYAYGPSGMLHVYGNETVLRHIRMAAAEEETPHNLDEFVQLHLVRPFASFDAEGYRITPLLAIHDPLERCYVYVIEREGKRLLYGNDTGLLPKVSRDYLRENRLRFDLVSLDCTMGDIPGGDYHMGIKSVLEFINRFQADGLADSKTHLVVNHFSHNGHMTHTDYEREMGPRGIMVTYDGFEVEF